MSQIPINRTNPNLVVPHLIVRTPLPTGTEAVQMHHLYERDELIASNRLRIEQLEAWKEELTDTISQYDARITQLEGLNLLDVPGMIVPFCGDTAPNGWLLCDGSTYLTSAYPRLFAIIGYKYGGSGDTFSVPDLRGRFVRGYQASLGEIGDTFESTTAAPKNQTGLTTESSDAAHTHTLLVANSSAHTHDFNVPAASAPHTHTISSSGGTHSHSVSTQSAHNHCIGEQGAPISAFLGSQLPSPLPYNGNEDIYDNLDHKNGTYWFFITIPNIYLFPNWFTDSSNEHTHTVSGGAHAHTVESGNAMHSHTGGVTANGGVHTHNVTIDQTAAAHAHSVNKTTGWDDETKPNGMLLNFIIRW